MALTLHGIHHLTAVTANVRDNYRFYTQVLGLRLVKRSVNQDDVSAYHLFYADGAGSPGTDITFFDWDLPREQRGTRSIVGTGLRVNGEAGLRYWHERLRAQQVPVTEIGERDGRLCLDCEDTEGQRLTLVDDGGAGHPPAPWERSPVPPEQQLRGLGPVTLSVPDLGGTDTVLTKVMNLRAVREYSTQAAARVIVYKMAGSGPQAELHVALQPGVPPARLGAGGVHHVAFRTPDESEFHQWEERLRTLGLPNSGAVDRYYFRSLYFREPNGILFEIATDGPGFGVDENSATLGEQVVLPPFLEPRRAQIVANLKPIE